MVHVTFLPRIHTRDNCSTQPRGLGSNGGQGFWRALVTGKIVDLMFKYAVFDIKPTWSLNFRPGYPINRNFVSGPTGVGKWGRTHSSPYKRCWCTPLILYVERDSYMERCLSSGVWYHRGGGSLRETERECVSWIRNDDELARPWPSSFHARATESGLTGPRLAGDRVEGHRSHCSLIVRDTTSLHRLIQADDTRAGKSRRPVSDDNLSTRHDKIWQDDMTRLAKVGF